MEITKAEHGGLGGSGPWRPAALGLRPRNDSAEMQQYLSGGFLKVGK